MVLTLSNQRTRQSIQPLPQEASKQGSDAAGGAGVARPGDESVARAAPQRRRGDAWTSWTYPAGG
jgi:hypothetical protein